MQTANDNTTPLDRSLEFGVTREQGTVRFHRYREGLRITDTTHAGKRGKVVEEMYVGAAGWCDLGRARLYDLCDLVATVNSYATVAALVECFVDDHDGLLSVDRRTHKGVEVPPAGFEEICISNEWMYLTAGYDSFTVSDLTDQGNMPRLIPTCHDGKKTAIKRLYAFAKGNREKIATMTFGQVWDAMQEAGVRSHYYCAAD